MGCFVGYIALKAMLKTLWCLLLLFDQIPIQQIQHVLLTVGFKFVYDLENCFHYIGYDIIGQFMSPGEFTDISNSFGFIILSLLKNCRLLCIPLLRTSVYHRFIIKNS